MPFTPIHMGPGIVLKALLQGSFSLMVFGWAQIIMDIQPLIVLITGEGHLHGFTHTYIGAVLIGLAAALTGKYAGEFGLRFLGLARFVPIGWKVALTSAFIGTASHVLLDSLMHSDVQPFFPFVTTNHFIGWVSIDVLHAFCLYSALFGGVLYFAVARWIGRRAT